MARDDRGRVRATQDWVFFDRGLVDAAVALCHATGWSVADSLAGLDRYHTQVFLAPPWLEIYAADTERRHGFDQAQAEYLRLLRAYRDLGYDVTVLPKVDVTARADVLLRCLHG